MVKEGVMDNPKIDAIFGIHINSQTDAGTIEVGRRADLVILATDPTEDIRNTRRIEAVYLAGKRL